MDLLSKRDCILLWIISRGLAGNGTNRTSGDPKWTFCFHCKASPGPAPIVNSTSESLIVHSLIFFRQPKHHVGEIRRARQHARRGLRLRAVAPPLVLGHDKHQGPVRIDAVGPVPRQPG